MVLLLSVYKSSLGKACFYFICDISPRAQASRGGEEGELHSLEATVDVWHCESEAAEGIESSLSESVALNNLKWHRETRVVCNSGGPVTEVWLTVPKTFSFTALLP